MKPVSFFSNIRDHRSLASIGLLAFFLWTGMPFATAQEDSAAVPAPLIEFKSLDHALEQPQNVIKLNLRKEKLTAFPEELKQFPNLKYLNLGRNNIKRIPEELGHLKNLEYLDLTSNEIDTLGPAIGDLENLRVLKLGNNEIYHIPPEIGNLRKLKFLELWSNNIYYLPTEAGEMKALKEIDLRGIMMNEQQQDDIRSIFDQKIRLQLSPSCNCL